MKLALLNEAINLYIEGGPGDETIVECILNACRHQPAEADLIFEAIADRIHQTSGDFYAGDELITISRWSRDTSHKEHFELLLGLHRDLS